MQYDVEREWREIFMKQSVDKCKSAQWRALCTMILEVDLSAFICASINVDKLTSEIFVYTYNL